MHEDMVHTDVNNEFAEPMRSQSWFESMSDKIHTYASKEMIVEVLIYFSAGAVLGFLSKKYLKHLLIALVLLFALIKGMEWFHIGVMEINWDHVKELTGLAPEDSISSVTSLFFAWVQSHVPQSIAIVIGMLIGSKIG